MFIKSYYADLVDHICLDAHLRLSWKVTFKEKVLANDQISQLHF